MRQQEERCSGTLVLVFHDSHKVSQAVSTDGCGPAVQWNTIQP